MADLGLSTPLILDPARLGGGTGLGAKAMSAEDEARVAKEFEAVFLSQAVDEMLKTVDLGTMSGGHAEEMWRSFLAKAIADELAGAGTTSISEGVQSAIAGYRSAQGAGDAQ